MAATAEKRGSDLLGNNPDPEPGTDETNHCILKTEEPGSPRPRNPRFTEEKDTNYKDG